LIAAGVRRSTKTRASKRLRIAIVARRTKIDGDVPESTGSLANERMGR